MRQQSSAIGPEQVALHKANMALLEAQLPYLAELIRAHQPLADLHTCPDGDWDVVFDDVRLYDGKGGRQQAPKELEAFQQHPQRSVQRPPETKTLDHHGGEFIAAVMKEATDQGIRFVKEQPGHKGYFLFVFGFGLGNFLENLIKISSARVAIILEPNLDFLYYSTFTLDWAPIMQFAFGADRCDIRFILSSDPAITVATIKKIIRETCPAAWDGALFFHHYNNSTLKAIYDHFQIALSTTALLGLGFFEDEMCMVTQTARNLDARDRYVITNTVKSFNDVPVFIVGNGPSLDQDIECLKRLADRAIIISCGSTLPVLLSHGIRPDFQVVLERGPFQLESCSRAKAIGGGLDGITLLASTTAMPAVVDLFEEVWFYFRPCLSSTPLFIAGEGHTLVFTDPMAANAGLNIALLSGFTSIYLLGVDIGSRHHDQDHSTAYVSPKGRNTTVSLSIEINGNFGGSVFSDDVYFWSKEIFEHTLACTGSGRQLFNCSNGAAINGFTPKHLSAVSLPPLTKSKEAVKRDVRRALAVYRPDTVKASNRLKTLSEGIDFKLAQLRNIVKEHWDIGDRSAISRLMQELELDRFDVPAEMVLRGSLTLSLAGLHYYAQRIPDARDLETFRKLSAEHFLKLLDIFGRQAKDQLVEVNGFTQAKID